MQVKAASYEQNDIGAEKRPTQAVGLHASPDSSWSLGDHQILGMIFFKAHGQMRQDDMLYNFTHDLHEWGKATSLAARNIIAWERRNPTDFIFVEIWASASSAGQWGPASINIDYPRKERRVAAMASSGPPHWRITIGRSCHRKWTLGLVNRFYCGPSTLKSAAAQHRRLLWL